NILIFVFHFAFMMSRRYSNSHHITNDPLFSEHIKMRILLSSANFRFYSSQIEMFITLWKNLYPTF
ncbi:hypothetical protein L9F63_003286, partial [Diploptera punctata]